MAEIFLAKMQGYSGFEKLVALKKILPRYSQNPAFARMLIHEAKLAARLQHFNVVQVLDLGEIDQQVFIAMEYVSGRDLAALLSNTYRRREKLPIAVSLCIATEFLTGLDYAHRTSSDDGAPLGLIHRDISPQNVLISYEGEVKLTDFGIARVIEQESEMRLPGNLHGKFGYMSPEQVEGRPLDQRSDIFSAGVVLHEMLTGQRLFRGKTPRATIEMIRSLTVQPPSAINPDVPVEVDRIIIKALARDREDRYQTVGALLGEVSRAADQLTQRASRRDLAVYMRRQFGTLAGRDAAGRRARDRALSRVGAFSLTAGARVPLGEILLARAGVRLEQLELALAEQRARGGRLGEILVESGVIGEPVLARALALQASLQVIEDAELVTLIPDAKLLARFPRSAAEGALIVPLSLDGAGTVRLVAADPYDTRAILETRIVLGVSEATVMVATKTAIRSLIARSYAPDPDLIPTPLPSVEPTTDVVAAEPPAPAPMSKPSVLIADPDPMVLESLASRLRDEELEVFTATDGKAARTICREKQPTVVVLDAALPSIDGYNVLLDLRSRESESAAFITSTRNDELTQSKALELGADDFIAKPFNLEVTTSKIRREISKRSGGKRAIAAPVQFNGVSGSLQDMTALDIVQSLELGRKSAQVVLQYEDGRSGELGVVGGEVKGATAGGLTGEAAFFMLARSGAGVFRIEYRSPVVPQNVERPNTYLILEALRRIDESYGRKDGGSSSMDLVGDLHADFVPVAAREAPKARPVPPPPASFDVFPRTPTGPIGSTFPAFNSSWSATPSPPPIPPALSGPWSIPSPPPNAMPAPSEGGFGRLPPPPPPAPVYRGPPVPAAPPPGGDTPTKTRLARVAIQRMPTTASSTDKKKG